MSDLRSNTEKMRERVALYLEVMDKLADTDETDAYRTVAMDAWGTMTAEHQRTLAAAVSHPILRVSFDQSVVYDLIEWRLLAEIVVSYATGFAAATKKGLAVWSLAVPAPPSPVAYDVPRKRKVETFTLGGQGAKPEPAGFRTCEGCDRSWCLNNETCAMGFGFKR